MNGLKELADATGAALQSTLAAAGVNAKSIDTEKALTQLWHDHGYSRHLLDFQWSRACSDELGSPTAIRPPWRLSDFNDWREGELPTRGRNAVIAIDPVKAQSTLIQVDGEIPPGVLSELPQPLIIFTRDWLIADDDDFMVARGQAAVEWVQSHPEARRVRASAIRTTPNERVRALAKSLDKYIANANGPPSRSSDPDLPNCLFQAANARLLMGDFVDIESLVAIVVRPDALAFRIAAGEWMCRDGADAPLAAVLRRRMPPMT